MTRPLFLRLSPAEQSAYERAAGALGVARWARAVLAQAAGVTAIPRGRGADARPRKKRGPSFRQHVIAVGPERSEAMRALEDEILRAKA